MCLYGEDFRCDDKTPLDLVVDVLKLEFSASFVDIVLSSHQDATDPFCSLSIDDCRSSYDDVMPVSQPDVPVEHIKESDDNSWPQVVPEHVKISCIRDYRKALVLQAPRTCSVCGRRQFGLAVEDIILSDSVPEDRHLLTPLRYEDIHPDMPWGPSEFCFQNSLLDGFMLERKGFVRCNSEEAVIGVCSFCLPELKRGRVPKFSYANHLYRGRLPEFFQDLTIMEEAVCCRYRSTAQIYRLKKSKSDTVPFVMSGNTCAHELNTVSTANVLPRTPSEVRDILSVVFIGSGSFDLSKLGERNIFRIRKHKVSRFLLWLSTHNSAYQDVSISPDNLALYPDDGTFPGLEDSAIRDQGQSPAEGVGFDNHVSDEFVERATTADVFLEKLGIYDPENDVISGRAIMASAVTSLLPRNFKSFVPDLFVAESNQPVPEYNMTRFVHSGK